MSAISGKNFVLCAIPTVKWERMRPDVGVSPQFLSKLHILSFGRIFAQKESSARTILGRSSGYPWGTGSCRSAGRSRRGFSPLIGFLPDCLPNLGNAPRRGAKKHKTF